MISLGYVCSLDAVAPIAAAGLPDETAWRIVPCSGYGSVVRQMKAGRLAGGLLPPDICATEFLSAHAPVQPWRIITLQTAQPLELVISHAARNLLKPLQQSSTLPFRIALDRLQSATLGVVEDWIKQHVPHIQARATYTVLPLNAIHRGMEITMIEAFVAPAPWGLMAQHQDLGTLQPDFHSPLANENAMALVIHSKHAVGNETPPSSARACPHPALHPRGPRPGHRTACRPGSLRIPFTGLAGCLRPDPRARPCRYRLRSPKSPRI